MHVAPGSQSGDENADGDEGAKLWDSEENQEWAVDIWGEIARRYSSKDGSVDTICLMNLSYLMR